jgi:hypothetical protein
MTAGEHTIVTSGREVPQRSGSKMVALEEVDSAVVRRVIDYWQALRAGRAFPARDDISPKELGVLLPNVALVRVIGDGADYEYRILGDSFLRAFGSLFQNARLSGVARQAPIFGAALRILYDRVRVAQQGFGYRGLIGRDTPEAKFAYHESALLPLGSGETVDHLLLTSVFVHRAI